MRLIIIGAGGHGQAVRELAISTHKYLTADGNENIVFLDDRYMNVGNKEQKYGTITYTIKGSCYEYEKYISDDSEFYPAFGDNQRRLEWEKNIVDAGGKLATIIHPSAYIAKSAILKEGSVVFPSAMINSGCLIGSACIVNMGAIIDHGCILQDACHINSGAIVMAENDIPKYTKVDSGEVIGVRKYKK